MNLQEMATHQYASRISKLSIRKNQRFFVIGVNKRYREYSSFENALTQQDSLCIVRDEFKTFFTPGSSVGFDWRISKFLFYNLKGVSAKLQSNKWTLDDIEITYKSSTQVSFNICISDSFGTLRRQAHTINKKSDYGNFNEDDIDTIIYGIDMLHNLSSYHSWEQIDLLNENKVLKAENENLKRELDKLSVKNRIQ